MGEVGSSAGWEKSTATIPLLIWKESGTPNSGAPWAFRKREEPPGKSRGLGGRGLTVFNRCRRWGELSGGATNFRWCTVRGRWRCGSSGTGRAVSTTPPRCRNNGIRRAVERGEKSGEKSGEWGRTSARLHEGHEVGFGGVGEGGAATVAPTRLVVRDDHRLDPVLREVTL